MNFSTIVSEGNLVPADLLQQIADGAAEGQKPEDFGFDRARRLTDEIAAAWSDAREYWGLFQRRVETLSRQGRLREDDPGTSLTREFWVERLLETLGYQLTPQRNAAVVENRTYFISHRAVAEGAEEGPPVHVEGFRTSLDQRPPSGRPRLSPHALVQEYLNATEQLWGIVTNGERLRLLRDSSRTTRPTYVEFDLRGMLEGEKFAEFAILYRLLHRSRLPKGAEDGPKCLLERYHQQAIEAGGRVREGLRDGVEGALRALGTGLLQHPANTALRSRVSDGRLAPLDYYRQLLRLVYRLLFLMVAEERQLIGGSEAGLRAYYAHYSVSRLRRMAEQPGTGRGRHGDLWLGLLATFRVLRDEDGAQALGVQALDGDLFGPGALPDLDDTRLPNELLLRAVRALSLYRDPQTKALRRVNYAALDVEELGSVYESLLDYRPVVRVEPSPAFDLVSGTERKTTGSYYTRPELVHELITSALEPVMEQRLAAAGAVATKRAAGGMSPQEAAILSIRVCDPACGSGHFLLAAARRLGRELARVRSGEDQPGPAQFRLAVRDVVRECIYGVDANPLAVDLCKVALWIESLEPGKPLSFLDSHIRWGNSLLGATRALVDAGIPDDAYKPVTGDDKAAASAFRKRNKKERAAKESGQLALGLEFDEGRAAEELLRAAQQLDAMPDDSVGAVRARAAAFERLRARGGEWWDEWTRHNLWTAAFFTQLGSADDPTVPTTQALVDFERSPASVRGDMVGRANALALELGFFHWELEFPQVFDATADDGPPTTEGDGRRSSAVGGRPSGFDVVLGNPPWERIKLQEQEHFVDVAEIAGAANKAARERMIQAWRGGDERQRARIAEFDAARYRAEAESRFVRASGRFPLTAVGDVNTYALFAEHARDLLSPTGRAGIIVPTGIATDDTTKDFFGDLSSRRQLVSLYDFENRDAVFPGVHRSYKFSLLTTGATSGPTRFLFFATSVEHLADEQRAFALASDEIALINPNTRTAPVFRTAADAELTKKIYRRVPVLLNERTGENPWGIRFMTMFHMSNDSHLFQSAPGEGLLPLYEAKLLHQFTHRWATYEGEGARDMTRDELADPRCTVNTRYWVERHEVEARLQERRWERGWLLGFRDITNATNERTAIFSLLPRVAVNHKAPLLFVEFESCAVGHALALASLNSLTLDFVTRQKVGGTSLAFFILKQLPVLPPTAFREQDIAFIVPRVLELVYTAWDMRPFAEDVWHELTTDHRRPTTGADDGIDRNDVGANRRVRPGAGGAAGDAHDEGRHIGLPLHTAGVDVAVLTPLQAEILRRHAACNAGADPALFSPRNGFPLPPFRWSDERRALIRAELDARIARLYGLTRDELRYILDPHDVYGPDFPGETFRVLKEKEIKLFGEYRTRRLVLEAWDREEGPGSSPAL
jgi:hypothetical protein